MQTRELVAGYLKGLLKEWYLVVIAIFDFIGMLIQPFLGFEIPVWVHLVVFSLAFVYANYSLYRDGRKEIVEIKQLYEGKLVGLQEKIAQLQDHWPYLQLLFHADQGSARYQVIEVLNRPGTPDFDELVQREAERLRPVPEEAKEGSTPVGLTRLHDVMSRALLQQRKSAEEYAEECDAYLKRYRQYLLDLFNYESRVARLRSLRFAVQNSGKVPAEDIVVMIHFPDEFQFPSLRERITSGRNKKCPEPPKRPTPFRSLIPDYASLGSAMHDVIMPPAMRLEVGPSNVSGPFIISEDSTEVRYKIQKLMHNFTQHGLDELEFFVTDEAIGHSWELKYSIHAANLPEPIEGSLLLEVRLAEDAQPETEETD
jgi:hypothetical protein